MHAIKIMDNSHHKKKNGPHDSLLERQRDKEQRHVTSTKKKSQYNKNNDTLLASKIDVLLQHQQPVVADHASSSSSSSTNRNRHHNHIGHSEHDSSNTKKKHQSNFSNSCSIREVYANECHVIALILLSRIQNFNLYLACWQTHQEQLLATTGGFLPRLLSQQQQQQEEDQQQVQQQQEEDPAAVDNNDIINNKDHDDYSLTLQSHWIRLVAHLLSRFDQAATATVAATPASVLVEDDDNTTATTINNGIVVTIVDALTEIIISFLLKTDETTIRPRRHPLSQQARVEAIMSLACALDIALSSPPRDNAMFDNVDRILSSIWGYYHDAVSRNNNTDTPATMTQDPQLPSFAKTSTPDNDDGSPKPEIKRVMIPNKEKEHFNVMLQTLTAMWNNDNDDDKNNDDEPAGAPMSSDDAAAADAAADRVLDACWYILSVYGPRMANNSSTGASTAIAGLPTFWQLALDWWCRCSKNHHPTTTHTRSHYLAWAELLLQMIQPPGTHDSLQFLLLLPSDGNDSSNGAEEGDNDDDIDSSSSSKSCCTAHNLFQLLLTCIVSPEQQQAVVHQPLGAAATMDFEDGHDNDHEKDSDKQQQPNNRVLRPLAWTCLTNLLQSQKVGWDWLLLMETTTKSSSSSGSSSGNRGRHLTTLVRLAVGEWKIQLGYYLVAGDVVESNGKNRRKQQEKQEDCETLIQVCGQFIVQTVQFIAQLADDVMDSHVNDDEGKKSALPLPSAANINHLRRSLDEALDATVQYLGLHPEQHGRVPQVDACVIRVLGSLLTEMNVFDQRQHRRPQKKPKLSQQQGEEDSDANHNATLHALRTAMELTTKSNKNTSKASSFGGEGVSLQEHEGNHALMPSLAYVLASAEGDEHCVQLLKDYNVLDRDILPLFLHSFWNQQRQEDLGTFASVVPWCCQVIELYVSLITVAETELLQADLMAWIRLVLQQLPVSSSSPASAQQQVLVKSLESVVSCYVTLQGETQPPEPDFSIIQQALETCARCLSSEKEK